jgi:acyl carrier protein
MVCLNLHIFDKEESFFMFENVKQFLVEELRVKAEDVTMEAELTGDLGINSLELAELVLACEEKFNVVIDDEDLHQFSTVGDVVTYLENNQ